MRCIFLCLSRKLKSLFLFIVQTHFEGRAEEIAGQRGRPALITQRKTLTAGSDQTSKQTEALIARLVAAAERGSPDEAERLGKQLSDHLTAARLPCDLLREKLAIARH